MMTASDALPPTGAFEEGNDIAEAVTVILRGIEQGGADFRRIGHCRNAAEEFYARKKNA